MSVWFEVFIFDVCVVGYACIFWLVIRIWKFIFYELQGKVSCVVQIYHIDAHFFKGLIDVFQLSGAGLNILIVWYCFRFTSRNWVLICISCHYTGNSCVDRIFECGFLFSQSAYI